MHIINRFRSVPLRNQFSEELELSCLLVCVRMTPIGDDATTSMMSAHALLQANRSVFAGARSSSHNTSTTTTPISMQNNRFPSLDAPLPSPTLSSGQTHSLTKSDSTESNDSTTTRKISKGVRLRKFLGSFGKQKENQ